ncbi:MAG: DivIVA domain-containing protein [Hamadaea sp.]|nr:DivIVA domain-containing protein [Hamadaea sp.]
MEFTVVLRGYDREQVDTALDQIKHRTLSAAAASRIEFAVAWRGYDREQVQHHLGRLVAEERQEELRRQEGAA